MCLNLTVFKILCDFITFLPFLIWRYNKILNQDSHLISFYNNNMNTSLDSLIKLVKLYHYLNYFFRSPQFSQLCVRVFDRNNVRTMKFDDFIQCCVMLKTLTDAFRKHDSNQSGVININYEQVSN